MHFREVLRIAIHSMRVGRFRTTLTMLGIVLSISLVIAMYGLNTGVKQVSAFRTTNSSAPQCRSRLS